MTMTKSKIDWKSLTPEEIFHKRNELYNTYEMMKRMLIQLNDRMIEIEIAFSESENELNNIGI